MALNDPVEPLNRTFFEFNRGVDTVVLRPLAETYRTVLPQGGQDMVRNFLNNLKSPVVLANDLLQGEVERAGETLGRFVVNTTMGVGGLFDVASTEHHTEDFGQTLAVWGVGEGPYLVLPLFGPSNPRDAFGVGVDSVGDPLSLWANNTERDAITYGRFGADAIDSYSRAMGDLETIEETSIDFYAAIRSLSRQHRRHQIEYGIYPDGKSMLETKSE